MVSSTIQQSQQFFFGQLQNIALIAAQDGIHQGGFFGLQFQNTLLNGVLGDELIHLDIGLLADVVGPLGGPILDGQIPPEVVVDDHISNGQIEAGSDFHGEQVKPDIAIGTGKNGSLRVGGPLSLVTYFETRKDGVTP